jgi:methionyl-tRNA formyltransferase
MRIVVLTSNTPSNVWLVNQILARHEVAGMVIEQPPLATNVREKRARRQRMLRKHGLWRTLNKLFYNALRWRVLAPADGEMLRTHFFPGNAAVAYLRNVPRVTVVNINDILCIELIKRHRPEVIAVCGTSVIDPEVFTLAPRGTLNIHTGITPEYRSADPIFWAIYNNEPDKVGATVHFVDKGIDTGPVIYQERVPLYSGDGLASITARCIRRGAALYLRALEDLERGAVRTLDRSDVKGRAFHSIDLGLIQYLIFLRRFRKLRRHLPHTKPAAASAPEMRR